ncbi:hypothetical protein ES288_D06G187200v1 [Gossypium darwinii]|uniref:Uncharacterized protein isoform X1 n=3 Tax=Gossypium TaxID=3633 RepID=A0ABM3A9D3_GOSHI|nr:uncharacterized protein LOC121218365 isoform X1 [Gossypium hirsutum]TYG65459.1 hypothetical protein ES288_D06G187200v1 [Gossypium darwinii]TYH67475.1 hypothetical protein ES332_D06G190000v1 [Gossypium tomentosum]
MAQASIKNFQLLRLLRSYAVGAEKMKMQAVALAALRVQVLAHDKEKEAFWMRDPKTGNWIPENHFGDIDVAELREKLLSRNTNVNRN